MTQRKRETTTHSLDGEVVAMLPEDEDERRNGDEPNDGERAEDGVLRREQHETT